MKNKKYIIGGIIIGVAAIFLAVLGLKSSLTFYYEVGALVAKGSAVYDKTVKVGGEVLPGIERNVSLAEIKFQIADITDMVTAITVVYHGSQIPDTFKETVHVIIDGKYTSQGIFEATSITTKCASKYIPVTTTGVSK
jgi:cytochrome c-type biogenesis protein CcmE